MTPKWIGCFTFVIVFPGLYAMPAISDALTALGFPGASITMVAPTLYDGIRFSLAMALSSGAGAAMMRDYINKD